MKQYSLFGLLALAMVMTFSSCQVVGGIFKAGVWVGILVVVFVVGLILWLVGRGRSWRPYLLHYTSVMAGECVYLPSWIFYLPISRWSVPVGVVFMPGWLFLPNLNCASPINHTATSFSLFFFSSTRLVICPKPGADYQLAVCYNRVGNTSFTCLPIEQWLQLLYG